MKKYLELGDEIYAHLQHMTKTKHQSFCRKKHFAKYIHLGFFFFQTLIQNQEIHHF